MKAAKILPLLLVASLTACSKNSGPVCQKKQSFYFDTMLDITFYAEDDSAIAGIEGICREIDSLADSHQKRDGIGVFDLNQTNEKVEINESLYNLLDSALETSKVATNFNPLVGSLSNKWKEALANKQVLPDDVIQSEIDIIENSSLVLTYLDSHYYAQRVGDAKIDLGGIAKGYALDRIFEYIKKQGITDYIINAGSSSVLLGKNEHGGKVLKGNNEGPEYVVGIRDASVGFHAYNCVISSSGNEVQGVEINGTTYSHIINPKTGSAITENDAVIVITERGKGYLGDALSTSLMMNTVEEIKALEAKERFQAIVVKNNQVVYSNPNITM